MAGYSDMIKRGIMENDMSLVVKGYNCMFGEKVELPSKRRKTEDGDDDLGVTGTGVTRPKRGQPVKVSGVNLFVDVDGEKRAEGKKQVVARKKTVKRKEGQSTALKSVKCSDCGEKHQVRRDLLIGDSSYTCSDCIVSRGSR